MLAFVNAHLISTETFKLVGKICIHVIDKQVIKYDIMAFRRHDNAYVSYFDYNEISSWHSKSYSYAQIEDIAYNDI